MSSNPTPEAKEAACTGYYISVWLQIKTSNEAEYQAPFKFGIARIQASQKSFKQYLARSFELQCSVKFEEECFRSCQKTAFIPPILTMPMISVFLALVSNVKDCKLRNLCRVCLGFGHFNLKSLFMVKVSDCDAAAMAFSCMRW